VRSARDEGSQEADELVARWAWSTGTGLATSRVLKNPRESAHARARPDSPLTVGDVQAGGAPLFIRFIRDELWPWLAARYNVAQNRTYVGDSLLSG